MDLGMTAASLISAGVNNSSKLESEDSNRHMQTSEIIIIHLLNKMQLRSTQLDESIANDETMHIDLDY